MLLGSGCVSTKNELYNRIESLICIREYAKAKRICNNPDYINDAKVQLQLMEIYYIERDYDNVIKIGTRPEFCNNIGIQLKLTHTLMVTGKLDEALALCEKKDFSSHIGFMQLKVKILRKMKTSAVTLKEPNNDNLSKECKFLLYIMSLAKKEDNYMEKRKLYEEALILTNSEALKNDPIAIYKKVIILKRLGRYEDAYEIANSSIYDNNPYMLVERVSLLFKMERYDEAMRVSMDGRISTLDNIVEIRKRITEKSAITKKLVNDRRDIIGDLEKIKNHEYDIKFIDELDTLEIYRDIMYVAYYEANKYPIEFNKFFIRELIKKYSYTDEYNKVINILKNRLLSSNKIFNTAFYYDLLKEYTYGELQRKRIITKKDNNI